MEELFSALLGIAFLVFFLGPTLRVMMTERPSDGSHIKAQYEGLQGKAGPNMAVISFTRCGTIPGGRSSPPARKYQVVLRGPDGREHRKIVGVTAGWVSNGELMEVLA